MISRVFVVHSYSPMRDYESKFIFNMQFFHSTWVGWEEEWSRIRKLKQNVNGINFAYNVKMEPQINYSDSIKKSVKIL